MGTHTKLTNQQRDAIAHQYEQDEASIISLAEKFKTTKYTIKKVLESKGIEIRDPILQSSMKKDKQRPTTIIGLGLDREMYARYQSFSLRPQQPENNNASRNI